MKTLKNLGRKLLLVPLALGSAVLWMGMFSSWINRGLLPEKEKALEQTIARQEAPVPAQVQEQAKAEPNPDLKAETAAQPPMQSKGEKPMASARQIPPADLQADRKQLESQGQAFMAGGHGLSDLPPVEGGADSVDTYIQFAEKAGYLFAVYSPEEKRYLGELKLGGNPAMVPLKLSRGFSQRGRIVEQETLLRMAQAAAGSEDVRLYALCPNDWAAYLAGKIMEAMKICGITNRRDVASFEAQFEVRGGRAVAVFKRALLTNGREVAINDAEG